MLNTTATTTAVQLQPLLEEEIIYPDSDGEPMSDNTEQWDLMVQIKGNLDRLLRHDFVASDLLWYPVKGRPDIRLAPDAFVALGRPKGYRGSYKQWEEGNQPPQVVFEIWSPGNTEAHKRDKLAFYEQYGVREYYTFDPFSITLTGWHNDGLGFVPIEDMCGWVSPLLGVSFDLAGDELVMRFPDGRPFQKLLDIFDDYDEQLAQAEAEREAKVAEREAKERAYAKLRELGVDPNSL